MKVIEKRLNKGYEIQLYYSKENGKYTDKTGNEKEVIQCDNVGEVAQWFARNVWGASYGDNNVANPTVWYNGTKWCFQDYSQIEDNFYYKGFMINNVNNMWSVWLAKDGVLVNQCDTYSECIERIDNQTI